MAKERSVGLPSCSLNVPMLWVLVSGSEWKGWSSCMLSCYYSNSIVHING